MDTQASYRDIVKAVLSKYAKLRPSHGSIRLDTVFDERQDHYTLMQSGWDQGIRVRGNLISADRNLSYRRPRGGEIYCATKEISRRFTPRNDMLR